MTARLLMIALDGADSSRLDRLSGDGTLPNLSALRGRGFARQLNEPKGVTDDGLWASFQYSSGPGEHGRYFWEQRLNSGEMGMSHLDEDELESFWCDLSRKGPEVGVFDIPKCGLPRPLNGIHLVDWLVHGGFFSKPMSFPDSLAAEVVEQFGAAPPSKCGYGVTCLDDGEVAEFTGHLRATLRMKTRAAVHCLESRDWGLFMVGFKELHCAGHHLWDLADSSHPGYDRQRSRKLGDPYQAVLEDADKAIGELIETAGEGAAIVVFSTTKMEPNACLAHLMPEIVDRMNRELRETWWIRIYCRVHRRLRLPRIPRKLELLPYNENCTALRINPDTRNSKSQILDRVEAMLLELTDAESGLPVVHAIDRPADEHSGARAEKLPDLLVRYRAGTVPRAVRSRRLGCVRRIPPALRPGDHASGGFLISTAEEAAEVGSLSDFGPFAFRFLGLDATDRTAVQ